jgi:hypothetical protein
MLQSILGSESREHILAFLVNYQEGYATEISRFGGMDLYAVQKQLVRLETGGLLQSRTVGRMRVYSFNPEYPLLQELKSLVEGAIAYQAGSELVESTAPLPESLRSCFWDYSFGDLSWEKDRELIVRRVLTDGSWDAITWLRQRMGESGLRKWLIAHRGRGLSPRQLRFWSLVLTLPKLWADAWTRAARTTPWNQR